MPRAAAAPKLKKNDHSYEDWMRAIPFGKTPDGKKLTRIHFVDDESDRDGRFVEFRTNEFVGRVTFLEGDRRAGYVQLSPGSIVVSYGTGSFGTLNERAGECVIWVHPLTA